MGGGGGNDGRDGIGNRQASKDSAISIWLGGMYTVKKSIDFHFEQKGRLATAV
tara:strand:- start:419 stop:577 length:159 start_codon:yes stop_codon:yes gene_type:complete